MNAEQLAEELLGSVCQLIRGPIHRIQDVSKGEMGVLGYLMLQGGTATPTEISKKFGVSTARITNVLNGLERKGYIVRTPSPNDRRMVLGTITEEGRKCSDRCSRMAIGNVTAVMDALGEEDAGECLRLVKRILQICQENPDLLKYPAPTGDTEVIGGST